MKHGFAYRGTNVPPPKGGYRDPVCLLKRALYGHPDAGSCWEVYAEEKIKSIGFETIPNWPGLFFRKESKVMLSVYVDDLKAAGPKEGVDAMWKELRKLIDIEPPTKLGRAASTASRRR